MSSEALSTSAGWYAVGGGLERYWDGAAWTDDVRAVPSYVSGHLDGVFLAAG